MTLEILQKLLNKTNITSFTNIRIETAVLSNVYRIQVHLEHEQIVELIAKFKRKELHEFHDMFRVESNFYTEISVELKNSFKIPKCIYASATFLLLACITSETFSVMQACPIEKIQPILINLAKMHSQFWKFGKVDKLASPAGIRSTLDGLTKETQFPTHLAAFLQDLPQKELLQRICKQDIVSNIRSTHDLLHESSNVWTMIHGDFHIGNILIQNSSFWLVDWATCGKGNPLRDVVFFLIVPHTQRRESHPSPFTNCILHDGQLTIVFID